MALATIGGILYLFTSFASHKPVAVQTKQAVPKTSVPTSSAEPLFTKAQIKDIRLSLSTQLASDVLTSFVLDNNAGQTNIKQYANAASVLMDASLKANTNFTKHSPGMIVTIDQHGHVIPLKSKNIRGNLLQQPVSARQIVDEVKKQLTARNMDPNKTASSTFIAAVEQISAETIVREYIFGTKQPVIPVRQTNTSHRAPAP